MPRVTHVKAAQQRYETVPVLNEDGTQQMRRLGTGTTKRGEPIMQRVTREDRSKPKPPLNCGACHQPIEVGQPYKWLQVKNTYGGTRMNRHETCPNWQSWELSNSISARAQQVAAQFEGFDGDTMEDAEAARDEMVEAIRELESEKREAAENLEEGFGHPTAQSEEITGVADQLDEWANGVEEVDLPEFPEVEDIDCDDCDGTGKIDNEAYDENDEDSEEEEDCPNCSGSGQVEGEEPDEDALNAWREEVSQAILDAVDACPL